MAQTITRTSATHIRYSASGHPITAPVWVYEIKEGDVLPVKFEYKQRGYKGLRFSDQKSRFNFNN